MTRPARIVVDTNVLVSRLLAPDSVPADALRKALREGRLLMSDATMREITKVLSRPKFAPYLSEAQCNAFIQLLETVAEQVSVMTRVQVCRDPKDDKFLELAIAGEADMIVTGDRDLLALHPYEGIRICAPAVFVQEAGA